MGYEDSECRHRVDGNRLRHGGRERLGEERDSSLGLGSSREKLGLDSLVSLRNEE